MTEHHIRLTSAEISSMWGGYMADNMAKVVLKYFINTVEDAQIKPIIEYALGLTEEHLTFITKLFETEQFPIPQGFTDEDVDIHAPRLFSDEFMLLYIRQMGGTGTGTYSLALASSARTDIRNFFTLNLKTAAELLNKATSLLEEKGLFIRPPYIQYPEKIEYVHKEGWMNGVFGDRRPANAAEITHLHLNSITNMIGKTLMTGFSQVAKSKNVVNLIKRGRDISAKHVELFSTLLTDDNVPAPATWDSGVMNSTMTPFSDKLILFHTLSLSQLGLRNYGIAISASPRRDLSAHYLRLAAEIVTFADDIAEFMIKNQWLEKMPGAVERDALIK